MPATNKLPVGSRFGLLVSIGDTGRRIGTQVVYAWRCDCGRTCEKAAGNLKVAKQPSCGCATSRLISVARTWHGASTRSKDDPLYKTFVCWMSMRWRCTNKARADYPNYGGRGITICARWSEFANFLSDMGPAPSGLTIDRIDTNGNYEPSNCRWATPKTQANNRRRNRVLQWNGLSMTVSQWAESILPSRATHSACESRPVGQLLMHSADH